MEGFDMSELERRLENDATNLEEKRDIFREEIFDWSDNFLENFTGDISDEESSNARSCVVQLWQAFVKLEVDASELENALGIYCEAAADSIAGNDMQLYKIYADFLLSTDGDISIGSKKFQHAFIYALSRKNLNNFTIEQIDDIWNLFLNTFNTIRGTSLNIDKLYQQACITLQEESEIFADVTLECPTSLSQSKSKSTTSISIKQEQGEEENTSDDIEDIKEINKNLILKDLDETIDYTPELLIKRYHQCPPLLLAPLASIEMMNTLPPLHPQDKRSLELYLDIKFNDNGNSNSDSNSDSEFLSKCNWIFDIIESLWVIQCLKERDYSKWFVELEEEYKISCIRSKEKMSAANTNTNTNSNSNTNMGTIKTIDDLTKYKKKLEIKLQVQREILTCIVNKSLLELQKEQISILTNINFPGFNKNLYNKIESYVIDHKLGSVPSELDSSLKDMISRQQNMLSFLFSKSGRLKHHCVGTSAPASASVPKQRKTTRFSSNLESDPTPSNTNTVPPAPKPPVPATSAPVVVVTVPPQPIKVESAVPPPPAFAPAAPTDPRRGKRKLETVAEPSAPAPVKKVTMKKAKAEERSLAKEVDDLSEIASLVSASNSKPATRRSTRAKK